MSEWDNGTVPVQMEALQKALSRQAFWKTAAFGAALMERQWPVYERASVGRTWGAAKEVRKVLDRVWQSVPTGVRIHDKYLLMLEENPVELVEEPWDHTAAEILENCRYLLEVVREKDGKAARPLAERNLLCLRHVLSACGEEDAFDHPLVRAELEVQQRLCDRLCQVPNREKAPFVAAFQKEAFGSLLGDCWFPDYPDYKPLKRKVKRITELRYTSTRYDSLAASERERNTWDRRQADIQARDELLTRRAWPDRPDGTPGRPLTASDVVRTYDVLQWVYSAGAKECLLSTGDGERAKALYGLAARSCEALLRLIDLGWPTEHRGTDGFGRDLLTPALCAYLAGDTPMALRLFQRSWTTEYQGPNCQMLQEPQTGWLDREEIRFLYELLSGNQENAQALLEGVSERWAEPYRLLLAGDGKGLHGCVVKQIRALRGHYEYQAYRPTVAFRSLVLLKLARRLGVAVEVPHVVELPPALLEDAPAHTWPLAGQELLEEALGPNGGKLLEKLKHTEEMRT